jgi:hypothetical protein
VDLVAVHSGGQDGGGFAVARGRDCFVVTAGHVVETLLDAEVFGRLATRAIATPVLVTKEEDVAVLRVIQGLTLCDRLGWPSFRGVQTALGGSREGVLQWRMANGGLQSVPVDVTAGDPVLRVTPRPGARAFGQGMSGHVVAVGGQPVGIMLFVDPGSGAGTARRLDRLGPRVTELFFRVEQRDRLYGSLSTDLTRYLFELQNVVGAFARDGARAIDREDALQTLLASQASYERVWRPLYDGRDDVPAEIGRLWGNAQAAEYRAILDGRILELHKQYVFDGLNGVRADVNAGRADRAARRDPSAFRRMAQDKASAVQAAVTGAVPELQQRIDAFLEDLRAPRASP